MAVKGKCALAVLAVVLVLSLPVLAFADTIITDSAFALDFSAGEAFRIQDSTHAANITFTVSSGALNGTATLDTTDVDGTLVIASQADGTLTVAVTTPSI